MRILTMAAAALIAGVMYQSAAAEPYVWRDQHRGMSRGAWCLNTPDAGPYDCGYATLQQCLASRAGVGGSCNPNPRYVEAQEYPAKKPRKTKRYYQ
jgi:hypothetical protein